MGNAKELRERLEWRRDGDTVRAGGVPFDTAWEMSVHEVCRGGAAGPGDPTIDAFAPGWRPFTDRELFEGDRDVWERAYNGEPWEHGDAASLCDEERTWPVTEDELHPGEPERRRCAVCDGPMDGRAPQARTCGDGCARAADHKRKARRKPSHITRASGEVGQSLAPSSRGRVAA